MSETIPLAVLLPLVNSRWKHDEYSLNQFALMVERHQERDLESGCTSYYCNLSADGETITADEFDAMVKAGAVPDEFYSPQRGINQHWLHSLEQFYAVVYKEWLAHAERTEALIGTPAGRIYRE